jgi:hypothetical protein
MQKSRKMTSKTSSTSIRPVNLPSFLRTHPEFLGNELLRSNEGESAPQRVGGPLQSRTVTRAGDQR